MPNLTDTQLIVLSNAAARDDGTAVAPSGLNKAAVAKVASSLIARKLMREMRSSRSWRSGAARTEKASASSLRVPAATRSASKARRRSLIAPQRRRRAPPQWPAACGRGPAPPWLQASPDRRTAVKGSRRIARDDGRGVTGWLPHSARAALSGLRKRGFLVERIPNWRNAGERASSHSSR